jgi:CRP-like cAMP-binding protein
MDTDPRSQNAFLASLGADDYEALRPHLRTVSLAQSRLLVTVGDMISQVYLPHGGVISLVVQLSQGERVEVAMIGRDSVLNLGGVLAGPTAVSSAVVMLPGDASVIDVELLREAAQRSLTLRTTLADHALAVFVQTQQTAACNAAHSVESRLARWLLRVHDLSGSKCFSLTQELTAQMIGARRNSVSIVASTMQQLKYIRYSRGHVEIIDLDGLNRTACECYAAVKAQQDRLLRHAPGCK